ncbi:glutathionylspermidine synthase family protein, partial [Pectobacterium brasiliense]|uniref:glutathionylspermidine synthase family protein n=1 Tax=Pectobacterium brasiliense TaxID=180957 RepID=UPI001968EEDE
GDAYLSDEAYYQFTLAHILEVVEATGDLHEMCLLVVEKVVIWDALLAKFLIPNHTWELFIVSWLTNQPSLYSLLDLAYDVKSPGKLLEIRAEPPTSLVEAAFFQWL